MKSLNLKNLVIGALSLTSLLVSFSATADIVKKSRLSVNFNQMIEQTSEERSTLENKIGSHYDNAELVLEEDDSQKVIDFVDAEIQIGEDRKMVDRRFNSVGEIRREEVARAPNSLGEARVEAPVEMQVTLVNPSVCN